MHKFGHWHEIRLHYPSPAAASNCQRQGNGKEYKTLTLQSLKDLYFAHHTALLCIKNMPTEAGSLAKTAGQAELKSQW